MRNEEYGVRSEKNCRRKNVKKGIAIIIVIFAVLAVFVYAANNKRPMEYAQNHFPENSFTVGDFGSYEDLYYHEASVGFSDTGTAIASYSDEAFRRQLKNVEAFPYLTKPVVSIAGEDTAGCRETEYIVPDPAFEIGEWHFRVLITKDLPCYLDMVGVNENERKIAYLTFFDSSLDYLCREKENKDGRFMEHFVKKYFKYDFSKNG